MNCDNIYVDFNTSFDVIYSSILKTFKTLGIILGFMAISTYVYNFIISLLNVNAITKSCMLCIMEISSGLKNLININIGFESTLCIVSFFLGFSSLSIIFQIFSCVYLNKFKLTNLLEGKLLHGIFSCIITYILINIPRVYEYVNIYKEVIFNIDRNVVDLYIISNHIFISLIISTVCIIILTIYLYITKKRLRFVS